MDNKTFEQISLQKNLTGDKYKLLKENLEVTITFMKPISIELPKNIECIVNLLMQKHKINSRFIIYKPATLDNGIKNNGTSFIESGEKIILDSRNMEYVKDKLKCVLIHHK